MSYRKNAIGGHKGGDCDTPPLCIPTLRTIIKNFDKNVAETAMGLVKSKLGLMMMQELTENKKFRELEKWFIVELQNLKTIYSVFFNEMHK